MCRVWPIDHCFEPQRWLDASTGSSSTLGEAQVWTWGTDSGCGLRMWRLSPSICTPGCFPTSNMEPTGSVDYKASGPGVEIHDARRVGDGAILPYH